MHALRDAEVQELFDITVDPDRFGLVRTIVLDADGDPAIAYSVVVQPDAVADSRSSTANSVRFLKLLRDPDAARRLIDIHFPAAAE